MKLTQDTKLYAKLLLSVGQQGRKIKQTRPLTPVECGQLIHRLREEENEPLSKIAERLDLGRPEPGSGIYKKRDTTQISLFLKLLTLSEKIKYFAGWGWEGYPKIPFSSMALLTFLSAAEQDKVVQSMYIDGEKGDLVKNDIIKIRKWKMANPDLSIDECITKVLKLKPVTITNHIIVCELHQKLKEFIKINNDYVEKILDMLNNNMDGKFYDVDTTDILITISMDENAYKTFHEQQYKKGTSFTEFLNGFLEDKIG